MLDELGEHCRVGDVVSTFDAGGAALFAAPSGGAFAGGAVAFHFTAAVAAWLVLRHCDTTPRIAHHGCHTEDFPSGARYMLPEHILSGNLQVNP